MLGAPPAFILSQDRTLRSNLGGSRLPELCVRGALPRSVTLNLGFASKLTSLPASWQVHFEFRLVCLRRSEKIAVSGSQGALRRCRRARAARGLTIRTRGGRRDQEGARPRSLHKSWRQGRAGRGLAPTAPPRAAPRRQEAPSRTGRGPLGAKRPLLVSGVLLSHGLTPQYHRRSGA